MLYRIEDSFIWFFFDKYLTFLSFQKQWIDEFLVWDPEEFDEVKQISIPTANIWVPDILINELWVDLRQMRR